jgi:hypothetical protein
LGCDYAICAHISTEHAVITILSAHLEPASVEEELQQCGERNVHVQVPQGWLKFLRFDSPCVRLNKLASNQGKGKEGVYSYGHHLEEAKPGPQYGAAGQKEMSSLLLKIWGSLTSN